MLNPDYVAPPNVSNGYYEGIALYENGSFLDYSRKLTLEKNRFIMVMGNGRFFRFRHYSYLNVTGRKQLLTQPMQTNSFGKSITVFQYLFIPLFVLKLIR
jgi:uncharacterized protein